MSLALLLPWKSDFVETRRVSPICSLQCFLVLWADFCLTLCPFAWLVYFKTYPALFQLSFRLMRQWLNRQYNLMPHEIPGTNRHFASNERISRRWRTEDRQQLPPRLSPWKQDHLQVFQRLTMKIATVTSTTCHSLKSSRLLWKWSIFDGVELTCDQGKTLGHNKLLLSVSYP